MTESRRRIALSKPRRPGPGRAVAFLFVYGTLRGGDPSTLLQPALLVGYGSAAGRLYDLGSYPGMVRSRTARERVQGQVYRLLKPKLTLKRLDRYEGCRPRGEAPPEYRRRRLLVRMDDGGKLRAWAYLFNGDLGAAKYLPSGDYAKPRRSQAPARTAANQNR